MNKLLLGHKGYLGSYIHKRLNLDILDARDVYDNGKSYEFIINCISKTNLDFCQENQLEAYKSNVEIIKKAKKIYPDAKIINFSTYYVYNSLKLCTEESPIVKAPKGTIYSLHKLAGEQVNKDGLNLRLGKLFGNPYNKQSKLTEAVIAGTIKEIDNVKFNPCSCETVVRVLENDTFLREQTGVFNLANDGITSHANYALFIQNTIDKKYPMKIVPRKPFYNYGKFAMDLTKIKQYFNLEHWQTDLKSYLEEIC